MKSKILTLCFLVLMVGCAAPIKISQHTTDGYNLAEKNDLDGAIEKYTQAIAKDSTDFYAFSLRGQAYENKGLYHKAVADYTRAIHINPEKMGPYINRGHCYIQIELLDKALADINIVLSPERKKYSEPEIIALAYYFRAVINTFYDRDTEALSDIEKGLSLCRKSEYIQYLKIRGILYFRLERYAESVKDLEQYLLAYPSDADAHFIQGIYYYRLGDFDKAKKKASIAVELQPRLAKYFSGDHLFELFDIEKRRKTIKEAIDIAEKEKTNDNFQGAFNVFERAYFYGLRIKRDDRIRYERVLEQLIGLYSKIPVKPTLPEEARRFNVQAEMYFKQKDYGKAIEAYSKSCEVAPWSPESHFNLALLYGEQKNYHNAIKQMNLYLALEPEAKDVKAARNQVYEWEALSK